MTPGPSILSQIKTKEDYSTSEDFDYTLKYNVVPAVAFGRQGSGEYGSRFGVKDPIGEYKDHLNNILSPVGWEVIKWMGITLDGKDYTGVEVETPIFPGIGAPIGKPAEAILCSKQIVSIRPWSIVGSYNFNYQIKSN